MICDDFMNILCILCCVFLSSSTDAIHLFFGMQPLQIYINTKFGIIGFKFKLKKLITQLFNYQKLKQLNYYIGKKN